MCTIYYECTRLWLVCAHFCTDLHEILNLSSQDSNWPPYKISWRSELSLWRYLQNNFDFPNTLIFNLFSIFSQFRTSKVFTRWIITENLWNFLETRYQNGLGYGRRWHHFKLTDCFLANVGIWYFPKIINEHPVATFIIQSLNYFFSYKGLQKWHFL